MLRICCAVLLPPSYARDNTTVVIEGISVFENTVARGSVVFVVNSVLNTSQVRTKQLPVFSTSSLTEVNGK